MYELEVKSLAPLGFSSYRIREDGVLFNKHGRDIRGNANGQVKLKADDDSIRWLKIIWLVAAMYVPNPNNFQHVKTKDGYQHNLHYLNLEWTPLRHMNTGSKRDAILEKLNEGWNVKEVAEYVESTPTYVRNVAKQRLYELEQMKSSI